MKVGFIIVFVIFLAGINLNAQFISEQGGKVMLKGKVLKSETSEPAGVTIKFKDERGKEIKTQSNINDGSYKVLLDAGKTYEVSLNGNEILKKTIEIHLEDSREYREKKIDFTVQKLQPGLMLANINEAFDNGMLNEKAKDALNDIKILLRFNRNMYINVFLLSDSQESDKVKLRHSALEEYIRSWTVVSRNVDNISIEKEYQNIKPVGNAQDIVVVVSRIKDTFGDK